MSNLSHQPPPPRNGRSFGKWIALLLAWFVGLGVWAVYVGVLFFAVVRFFAG